MTLPLSEDLLPLPPEHDKNFVSTYIGNSINCLSNTLNDQLFQDSIILASKKIRDVIKNGGKILIAGNGGSASDAQHFAGELVSRFLIDSSPYPAISLTTDTSAITAISNDYGYEHVFSRQLRALASPKDLFFAITTSGKSENILNALNQAQNLGLFTCSLTGSQGLADTSLSDINIKAESTSTPHIQELHSIAIHLVCALVEANLHNDGLTK